VRVDTSSFLVDNLGHGGCARHTRPVIVELQSKANRWTAIEFRDPSRKSEGLIPLLKRLHPTAK
jgi:hypothetical protein